VPAVHVDTGAVGASDSVPGVSVAAPAIHVDTDADGASETPPADSTGVGATHDDVAAVGVSDSAPGERDGAGTVHELVAAAGVRLSAPTVSVGVPATHVDAAAVGESVTPPAASTGVGAVHVDTAAEGVNVTGVPADAIAAGGRKGDLSAIAVRPMMPLKGRARFAISGACTVAPPMSPPCQSSIVRMPALLAHSPGPGDPLDRAVSPECDTIVAPDALRFTTISVDAPVPVTWI
jgi:hypothetical protein